MYLIDIQYFPTICNIYALFKHNDIKIVAYERFRKSTFRNRCIILGSNGPIHLSIPLKSGRDQRAFLRDIEISYDTDWQTRHWRSVLACYSRSPYFEFYEISLYQVLNKKEKYLFDYNWQILEKLASIFQFPLPDILMDRPLTDSGMTDFRDRYTPANFREAPIPASYTQVFMEKTGFVPNLSCLDILCNIGPDCVSYFRQAI